MGTPKGLLDDVGGLFGPDERRWGSVPPVDVVSNMLNQGTDRVNGASANRFAGENTEPGFNHVQPGGTGRGEMEMNTGMAFLPRSNFRSLVCRGVVENDVQIALAVATGKNLEEPEEVGAGVPVSALSNNLPGGNLQSCVEARQAVATVVVGLAGWQSRPKRQDRLGSVESLDLNLLVDAQDHGIGWRGEVQSDNIVNLRLGLGVAAELERLDPMGLQVMSAPDPVDGAVRHLDLARQIARAPVRHAGGRRFQCHRNNLSTLAGTNHKRPARAGLVLKPQKSCLGKAPTEPANLNDRVPAQAGDLRPRDVIGHQQHHACPAGKSRRDRRRSLESLQLSPFGSLQNDGSRVVGHVPSPMRCT